MANKNKMAEMAVIVSIVTPRFSAFPGTWNII